MPAKRFVQFDNRQWTISELARHNRIAVGTLAKRLARFSESATGIARALATGIQTPSMAGQRGAQRSPWRYPA